jgi:hypothetical protein
MSNRKAGSARWWVCLIAGMAAAPAFAVPITLSHQLRVTDGMGGTAIACTSVTVGFWSHATSTAPSALRGESTHSVAFEDGYVSLNLPADSEWFASPTWLGVSLCGSDVGPRQALVDVPSAGRARVAGAVPVEGAPAVGPCTPGSIAYDTVSDGLRVCDDAASWRTVGTPVASTPPPSTGDGSDGALVVTGTTIVNAYTHLISPHVIGATVLNVADTTGFQIGDQVLVAQMQSGSGSGAAGRHEFVTVTAKTSNTLTLAAGLTKNFGSGAFNTPSASVTQVVRVPHYTSVTIAPAGKITAKAWDGQSGGIVAFRSQGTVQIEGQIDVTAQGFRGGRDAATLGISWNTDGMEDGESWTGRGTAATPGTNNGGGGGGSGYNNEPPGGGGGSYATAGGTGTLDPNCSCGPLSAPGTVYGVAQLTNDALYLGSGGGSGMRWSGSFGANSPGGAGGGAVYVVGNPINVIGSIQARGAQGADSVHDYSSSGGSGSGGSVYLSGPTVALGASLVVATGGASQPSHSASGHGGAGGTGRVQVDATSVGGASSPAVGYTGTYSP